LLALGNAACGLFVALIFGLVCFVCVPQLARAASRAAERAPRATCVA
jgi:hypothetical protein